VDPVIRFENVTKRYGSNVALDNLSLEVPPGMVFALLGENGAGKSTSIKSMLGLTTPDSGSVDVLGLDSRRDGIKIRRSVGYVPEQPVLYDWMRIDQIGWFTSGFYGDGFLTRYHEQIKRFDLPLKRKLKNLSKGMRAKVALSLALAHDPQLLILDEPTSGLDTMVRREFLESMVDLTATGRSVLLSSHQINEVERVADMVAIIHQGKLVLVENLDDLKDQTQQLTITVESGHSAPPYIDGQVLRSRRRARQWQVMVRGATDEMIATLRSDPGIVSVESARPSLEDIFVAHMQSDSGPDQEEANLDRLPSSEGSTLK